MADAAQTPSGWIPTFESIKGISWGSIGKWVTCCLALLLGYAAYANLDVVKAWVMPTPKTIVEYVPAAKFETLQAEVIALQARAQGISDGVSAAEFEALKARVNSLEAQFKKRRR